MPVSSPPERPIVRRPQPPTRRHETYATDVGLSASAATQIAGSVEWTRQRAATVGGRETETSRGGVPLMLFGVLLPLATIVIELVYRMCSQEIFDPIPTPWHLALALAVPVGNLAAWLVL